MCAHGARLDPRRDALRVATPPVDRQRAIHQVQGKQTPLWRSEESIANGKHPCKRFTSPTRVPPCVPMDNASKCDASERNVASQVIQLEEMGDETIGSARKGMSLKRRVHGSHQSKLSTDRGCTWHPSFLRRQVCVRLASGFLPSILILASEWCSASICMQLVGYNLPCTAN